MIRFVSFVFAALIASPTFAQRFEINPSQPVLIGEPISIKLFGLPANQIVNITAERVLADSQSSKLVLHRAEATFVIPNNGSLDLSQVTPKNGSYKRSDPRGLFWSMQPSSEPVGADRKPMEVFLKAHLVVNDKPSDNQLIASSVIKFIDALPSVKSENVERFPGAVFAVPSIGDLAPTKRPAIILLGGSEGGAQVTRGAARLASYGFAVLALPYYSLPDWATRKAELPTLPATFTDIPIERLNEARAWLQTRSDVDSTRIALYGTSKGAEFALLAGVHFAWVTSIVAVVPTDVVWEGWGINIASATRSSFSLNGKPFAFVPYADFEQELKGFQTGEIVRIRRPHDNGRAANPQKVASARIPVEQIKGSVLLIAGQDDQLWNSGMMAQNIAERRAAQNLDTVLLNYSDAGHFLGGSGFSPTTQYDVGLSKAGGTPEGNARAQADAWPKTITFLKRTLGVR